MARIRGLWNKDNMVSAIMTVRLKEKGYQRASKMHKVPNTTLKRYVQKANEQNIDPNDALATIDLVQRTVLGSGTVLPKELEDQLVEYCIKMESSYFGLRRKDVRRLAFQLANSNKIPNPFSKTNDIAGKKWLRLFLNRHPNLSFRRPQRISVARAQSFTESNINQFFSVLKPELQKIEFKKSRTFNCDETGITIVQHSSQKVPFSRATVLTVKGKREVHKLSSAERGGLITVVLCMSAAGIFVPPMVIFPRKNRKDEFGDDLPDDSVVAYSKSGWITSQLFTKWFMHFVEFINASETNPAVLVFDGHYSHTRNMEIIDIARKHHVSLVSLPPHTSGKTQPLDVAFMKAFKTYYSNEVEDWMDSHNGRILTHYALGKLFTAAYDQSATIRIAKSGFKRTGIAPFKANVFETDPKLIKDVTGKNASKSTQSTSSLSKSNSNSTSSKSDNSDSCDENFVDSPRPSTSAIPSTAASNRLSTNRTSASVSPEDIRPIPQIPPAPPSNRRQHSEVISASPHKNFLLRAEALRIEKEEAKIKKAEERKAKKEAKDREKLQKQQNKEKKKAAAKKKSKKK